jgi:hypothetical protein
MIPSFEIPPQYFYALASSLPPDVSSAVRYRLATQSDEAAVIDTLRQAIDAGVIVEDPVVTVEMAARRLRSLGNVVGLTPVCASGVGLALTTAYTDYQSTPPATEPAADIAPLWNSVMSDPALARAHLELVLCAITQDADSRPLVAAVNGDGFALDSVQNLDVDPWPAPHPAELTLADWTAIFTNHPDLLPASVGPGSLDERIGAFVRMLEAFFKVTAGAIGPSPATPGAVPRLRRPLQDLIKLFFDAYRGTGHAGWEWGDGLVDTDRDTAIGSLNVDAAAGAWLTSAVSALDELYAATAITGIEERLHFTLTESLYARGFNSRASITAIDFTAFAAAVAGTPAHDRAEDIYRAAGGDPDQQPGGQTGPFAPINPGDLVNCTPPCELSPTGDLAYLHQLLNVDTGSGTLGDLLTERAGQLAGLAATSSNAMIQVPLIDVVNESLEAMAGTGTPHGVAYDTDPASAGGHDPSAWFQAVPEHSSPAVPVAVPAAYDALAGDFSGPDLPYDQRLDVNRRYLEAVGTTRFDVLRGFRRDITEFVLDRAGEPAAFPRHVWRYPVRLELALEYLCISQTEYEVLFGGSGESSEKWRPTTVGLPELLSRLGIDYCDLVDLVKTGYLPIHVVQVRAEVPTEDEPKRPSRRTKAAASGRTHEVTLPDCEPCCLADYAIEFDRGDRNRNRWVHLIVFVRLWRKLRCTTPFTFAELAEVCQVLGLLDANGEVDADFVPQLAALLMLRADFGLTDVPVSALLDLWRDPTSTPPGPALEILIHAAGRRATRRHAGHERTPRFHKLLRANLDQLSTLAGFDPTDPRLSWHARPTHTLRFAEQLAKIHASGFGVGELIYLCTADEHLAGDDPYPLEDMGEAEIDPLREPDEAPGHALWDLRARLLAVRPDDETVESYTWSRIGDVLRDELGWDPAGDQLTALGTHLFPEVLGVAQRRYTTHLAGSTAAMWNTPGSPFRYDDAASELSTAVPLDDDAVLSKLTRIRPLQPAEAQAVRDLYADPRRELAGFGYLFPDLDLAWEHLVAEPDEQARWHWFRARFALFHARCDVIADHLAGHVLSLDGGDPDDAPDGTPSQRPAVRAMAWRLLRVLLADENLADPGPWARDDGHHPSVTWPAAPVGGAFAAITGLTGTGLLAEHAVAGTHQPLWRELQGTTSLYDPVRGAWNAPAPTLLPALDAELPDTQRRFAGVRNGIAIGGRGAEVLGGVQAFASRWSGLLLVETDGDYTFWGRGAHRVEDGDEVDGQHWQVRLGRGQKEWTLLSHDWADTPDCYATSALALRRGVYEITIELTRDAPEDDELEDARALRCGLRVEYRGPDTDDQRTVVPTERLYLASKDARLDEGVHEQISGVPRALLREQYVSTLRDVRRTYQRAFKAVLLAYRLGLSAETFSDYAQSELGYLLDHGASLAGLAFYRDGGNWHPHAVDFDPNLLPLRDNYRAPAADDRTNPGVPRRQAWFDVWERLFDHTDLRARAASAPEEPVWLLYDEAAENQPDDPAQLLRHLGVELSHAPLVLAYDPGFAVAAADLTDERWSTRVWHADQVVRQVDRRFRFADLADARPGLWAAADPLGSGGNANLTAVVRAGYVDSGKPKRYKDLRRLDDCLREHARDALVAYLTAMDRVPLPGGGHARTADDLSDLLLMDVSTRPAARVTRIGAAIGAAQSLVARARLGLEPGWRPTAGFLDRWDRVYAGCDVWAAKRRAELYPENGIARTEQELARRTEAFRLLEDQLRRATMSVPAPGGLEYWTAEEPPAHPGLALLQERDASGLALLAPAREGLGLLGAAERAGARTWLAARVTTGSRGQGPGLPGDSEHPPVHPGDATPAAIAQSSTSDSPLWIEAAIRLGTRFLRVPAACVPPASQPFAPAGGCGCGCAGGRHLAALDEFYFWLADSAWFDEIEQVADWPGWHDQAPAASLLEWPAKASVHLVWCHVRDGEIRQPRRSPRQVALPDGQSAATTSLTLVGREHDSLLLRVGSGQLEPGAAPPPDPGFRYDLAADEATAVPTVSPAELVAPQDDPGLGAITAYPYFVYFPPGAPLFPADPFAEAITVACTLRGHCSHEAATHWYALSHDPMAGDNRWCQPGITEPEQRRRGHCCDGSGADAPTARKRHVTLEYLETLLEWARCSVLEHTAAGRTRARLILDSAARILGPTPETVSGCADDTHDKQGEHRTTVATFTPCTAPLNPWLMSLYERVADQRAVLRVEAEVDQDCCGECGADHAGCGQGGDCSRCCCPPSPYRFTYVLGRAGDFAAQVSALGAELQAALEKGDVELLAAVRGRHEQQVFELNRAIRKEQWRDADWQVQSANIAKQLAQTRYGYYDGLVNRGLVAGEIDYRELSHGSFGATGAATVSEAIGTVLGVIPDVFVGTSNFTQLPLGTKLQHVFTGIARISGDVATILSGTAGLRNTEGGWDRRLIEWQFQRSLAALEIAQAERLILAAERRRAAALGELNAVQAQLENSREVNELLRDKATTHAHYLWLYREVAALYRQMYELADCAVRQAQRAFNVERGFTTRQFVPDPMWDNLREGLTAGQRLTLAVRRMDAAYTTDNVREYELTKHVSFRKHFGKAFLDLKVNGECTVELPEWLFDLDYPGHYLRRVKSVSLTVPAVVGPYTGVHARLTLLANTTRVRPNLLGPAGRCCGDDREQACGGCGDCASCPCGCSPPCGSAAGYALGTGDCRAVRDHGVRQAIATSSGQNDSGLFELAFRDERYLPFEYSGAVSTWKLEIPKENNDFDLDTLSDVVLHVNYTAREGGPVLRAAAQASANEHIPDAGERLIDLAREMPEEWAAFTGDRAGRRLDLRLSRDYFACVTGGRGVLVRGLELFIESADACPSTHVDVEFEVESSARCEPDTEYAFTMTGGSDWCGFYYGTVDVTAGPVTGYQPKLIGSFEFETPVRAVTRAFLLVHYELTDREPCRPCGFGDDWA